MPLVNPVPAAADGHPDIPALLQLVHDPDDPEVA